MHKNLYLPFLSLWLGIFGFGVWDVNRWAGRLQKNTEDTEKAAIEMNERAAQIRDALAQTKDKTAELEFLQNLINFIPQTEGFVRTQKALMDEVQTLRTKVSKRVKGKLQILIDTKTNKLFLKEGVNLLWEADCSVGRGGTLSDKKTGRRWEFVTPRGKLKIINKVENPVWIKPDWAFVETSETVPPPGDPARRVEGELGAYLLNLGDGYLIHGTKREDLLGQPASHGCVRLGAENLKNLYEKTPVGTEVYIF